MVLKEVIFSLYLRNRICQKEKETLFTSILTFVFPLVLKMVCRIIKNDIVEDNPMSHLNLMNYSNVLI